jgi:hypothetical protein
MSAPACIRIICERTSVDADVTPIDQLPSIWSVALRDIAREVRLWVKAFVRCGQDGGRRSSLWLGRHSVRWLLGRYCRHHSS